MTCVGFAGVVLNLRACTQMYTRTNAAHCTLTTKQTKPDTGAEANRASGSQALSLSANIINCGALIPLVDFDSGAYNPKETPADSIFALPQITDHSVGCGKKAYV